MLVFNSLGNPHVSLPCVSISFFGVKILEKTSFELCKKVFDDSLLKKSFLVGRVEMCTYREVFILKQCSCLIFSEWMVCEGACVAAGVILLRLCLIVPLCQFACLITLLLIA